LWCGPTVPQARDHGVSNEPKDFGLSSMLVLIGKGWKVQD